MNFLGLPTSIICNVLSNVSLADVVRLDSACCHRDSRAAWSELLRFKQLTLRCSVDMSNLKRLQWLQNKKLVTSSIVFCKPVDERKVTEYLRRVGSRVREVVCRGGDRTLEMNLVAIYCKSLIVVRCVDTKITRAFNHLMWCNANIREIQYEMVRFSESDTFADLSLPMLEIVLFSCFRSSDYNDFPWHKSSHCDSLHTLVLDCVTFPLEDIDELAQNCPQLRSFSCNHVATMSNCLARIIRSMPQLVGFSTTFNSAAVDSDILTVAQTLTNLYTLNLMFCTSLTDLSLRYIAEHCGNTLEVLYTDIKNPESPETEHILEIFGQKCVKLKYLNVFFGDKSLCTGKAVCMLLRGGCLQLHTFVVNKHSTICESSRAFIALVRPTLKVLVHNKSTEYNILSMSI